MMKLSGLFAVLSLFVLLLATTGADAAERLPFKTYTCYKASRIVKWKYVSSSIVRNGVQDRRAYVELQFNQGRDHKGLLIQTLARVPVTGLSWDKNFRSVIHTDANGRPVVCATESFWGQKIDLRNCYLDGLFTDRPDLSRPACDGEHAVGFDGAIVVLN